MGTLNNSYDGNFIKYKEPSRNMDVWGIYRDPEHIYDALKIIGERKDEIKNPLILFTGLNSVFKIGNKKIDRHFDTLIWSEEADIVLMLSSARYTNVDCFCNEVLVSALPTDIVDYLENNNIPYIIVGPTNDTNEVEVKDDKEVPEIWFARDKDVLEMALNEGIELGTKKITNDSDTTISLSIGYVIGKEFIEIWGLNGNGLVKTDCNWTVIIDENYSKNLNLSQVKMTIISKRIKLLITNLKKNLKRKLRNKNHE